MPSNSIVFVDSRVANYQSLIDSLNEPYEVFILDGDKDGLDQMAGYLKGRSALDAIHVISHGSQGALYLGSTVLDNSKLAGFGAQLGSIGASLTQTGDLMLYGCNVAQGDAGVQSIDALAKFTGAGVAASADKTGAAVQGGNLSLGGSTGALEVGALTAAYDGILAVINGSEGKDSLLGAAADNTMYGFGGDDTLWKHCKSLPTVCLM